MLKKLHNLLIQELYNLLDSVFSICDSIKAKCQLQEGSLLGAVKLSNILPWERDADVAVLSSDFENLVHYLKGNTEGKLKLCNNTIIAKLIFAQFSSN